MIEKCSVFELTFHNDIQPGSKLEFIDKKSKSFLAGCGWLYFSMIIEAVNEQARHRTQLEYSETYSKGPFPEGGKGAVEEMGSLRSIFSFQKICCISYSACYIRLFIRFIVHRIVRVLGRLHFQRDRRACICPPFFILEDNLE